MSQTESSNTLRNKLIDIFDDDSLHSFQQFMASSRDLMSCYRCAIMEIETKFRVLDERFSLAHDRNPIDDIQSRLKSPESIRDKLLRKNLPFTLEAIEQNLFDVAGVRIVCSFIDDIYMLADCLMQQDDITLIKQKDYIKQPKANGYRSLHLIVEVPIFLQDQKKLMKVEVQFRTIAMESWANLEHQLRYKKSLSPDIIEKTEKRLGECAKLSNLLDTQMQEIKDVIENA
ncbi:MAG: GTP pyrophosphokinase family protein [Lachnospiraceae bacterium]|jgi:putative GTP pyrophosphokinase|nr:GTP pyrophosphokinase family protein [Lachnospiraceae bacterium]